MLNDERASAIRARADKATPGPWEYDGMHSEIVTPRGAEYWLIVSECRSAPDQPYECDEFGHQFDANLDFIAHAREDIPALLSDREELQRQLAEAQADRKRIAAALFLASIAASYGKMLLDEHGIVAEEMQPASQEFQDAVTSICAEAAPAMNVVGRCLEAVQKAGAALEDAYDFLSECGGGMPGAGVEAIMVALGAALTALREAGLMGEDRGE